MNFMSWLFGSDDAKESKVKAAKKKKEEEERKTSTRSLIASVKADVTVEDNGRDEGNTQQIIKAELDAAARADAKRLEQAKETDEKVEAHRKRADTVMRQVAEKTCGLSDIVVRRKSGEYTKKKVLTEEEQEVARKRGLEHMRKMGWRES